MSTLQYLNKKFLTRIFSLHVSITFLLLPYIGTANANPDIKNIRQEYKLIRNELNLLKKESKPLNNYSGEGGAVHAFRNENNIIRLIKVELYGESSKAFYEYYYKNNKLIFSFYELHKYNVPFLVTDEIAKEMGGEAYDPKKTKIIEDRYYFKEEKLIRWLNNLKKESPPKSKEFIKMQDEVNGFSNDMLDEFN